MSNEIIRSFGEGWILVGRYWYNTSTGRILPVIQGGGSNVYAQQAYRFVTDDGAANAGTLEGSGNNEPATKGTGTDNRFRVRIVIEETANSKTETKTYSLRYSYDGGAYTAVTDASSVVRSIASANTSWTCTDGDATTARLSFSGSFIAGEWDSDGTMNAAIGLKGQYTELEFCVYLVDADVADTKVINLEVYADGAGINAYNQIPQITVSKGATVHQAAMDLSGTGALSATGKKSTFGAIDTAGSGTLGAVGQVIKYGATDLAGSGNLAATGLVTKYGAIDYSGAATVGADAALIASGELDLSGSGVVSATGTIIGQASETHEGTAVFSGVGTLEAAGSVSTIFAIPFFDGFETGDARRWAGTVGSPTINNTAALVGSYGMEISYGQANTYSYLSWTNTTRQTYRVKFKLDTNNIDATTGTLYIFILFDGAKYAGLMQLYGNASNPLIRVVIQHDDDTYSYGTPISLSTSTEYLIEVEFVFADNTGYCRVWLDGARQTSNELSNQDTGTRFPDIVRFGSSSTNTKTSGSIYLDAFVLHDNVRPEGAIGLSGSGTLSATGTVISAGGTTHEGAADLSGTGTLDATGQRNQFGAGDLSGSGTLTAAGQRNQSAQGDLSGTGTLSADSELIASGELSLDGSGTLSADGVRQRASDLSISGSGVVSGAAVLKLSAALPISGTGTLSGSGSVSGLQEGEASLSGSGTLAAEGVIKKSGAISLSGTGTIIASGSVAGTVDGEADLSGSGLLAANGVVNKSGQLGLSGSGILAADGTRIKIGAMALSGSGVISGAGVSTIGGTMAISGSGLLAGDGNITLSGALLLSGTGTLVGSATVVSAPTAAVATITIGDSIVTALAIDDQMVTSMALSDAIVTNTATADEVG